MSEIISFWTQIPWEIVTGVMISLTLLLTFASSSAGHRNAALLVAMNAVGTWAVVTCPFLNTMPERLIWKAVVDFTTIRTILAYTEIPLSAKRIITKVGATMIALHLIVAALYLLKWPHNNWLYLAALDGLYYCWLITLGGGAIRHGISLHRLGLPDLSHALHRLFVVGGPK